MLNKKIYLLLLWILIASCENGRPFEWTEEEMARTGGDLKAWIRKAPFQGEWDPEAGNENSYVITNIAQVFPFLGKFENEEANFVNDYTGQSDVYDKATVIFKDPDWGEVFVFAMLTYTPQPLFLKDFYSEMGNVALSGTQAIHESHTAKLTETKLLENRGTNKANVYWVLSNQQQYLSGFYQNGRLVLQFAFPCPDTTKGLTKLKAINKALGIHNTSWDVADENKLTATRTNTSFWKDPYFGMQWTRFIPEVSARVNNTPFERYNSRAASAMGVDYLFKYEDDTGQYMLSFSLEKREIDQENYEAAKQGVKFFDIQNDTRKVYILEERNSQNEIHVKAEAYYKDNQIIKITSKYPSLSTQGAEQLHNILSTLRIRRF